MAAIIGAEKHADMVNFLAVTTIGIEKDKIANAHGRYVCTAFLRTLDRNDTGTIRKYLIGAPRNGRAIRQRRPPPAEVGSGILKWDKILPAAYDAGVRHCYVEQEPPFVIPRMEAASFALLSKLF